MLKCIQCGSEDEFLVDEMCTHTIRVRCGNDWEYIFVEEEEFKDIQAWGDVACVNCGHITDSEDAKSCYDDAHNDDICDPIPYVLVDASTT